MNLYVVFSRFNLVTDPESDKWQRNIENKDWWSERLDVMKRYTYLSIESQQVDKLLHVVPFPSQTPDHAEDLMNFLEDVGSEPCIEDADDRVFHEPYKYILSRVSRFKWDKLVLVNLDSDDMYAKTALAHIDRIDPEVGTTCVFQKGYIYDIHTKRLAHYYSKSPPFFAWVLNRKAVESEEAYKEFTEEYRMNGYHYQQVHAKKVLKMPHNEYCYTVNSANDTTSWTNPNTVKHLGEDIRDEDEKREILERFGHYEEN